MLGNDRAFLLARRIRPSPGLRSGIGALPLQAGNVVLWNQIAPRIIIRIVHFRTPVNDNFDGPIRKTNRVSHQLVGRHAQ